MIYTNMQNELSENLFDTGHKLPVVNNKPISLMTSIKDLNLKIVTYKCLWLSGIRTLADLISKTPADLLNIKGFGRKSLEEVSVIVHSLGYNLKDEIDLELTRESLEKRLIDKMSNRRNSIFKKKHMNLISLKTPIEELSLFLSTRVCNCLKRSGIQTLGQLISNSPEELLKINNIGVNALNELISFVHLIGYKFKGEDQQTTYNKNVVELSKKFESKDIMVKRCLALIEERQVLKKREQRLDAEITLLLEILRSIGVTDVQKVK